MNWIQEGAIFFPSTFGHNWNSLGGTNNKRTNSDGSDIFILSIGGRTSEKEFMEVKKFTRDEKKNWPEKC